MYGESANRLLDRCAGRKHVGTVRIFRFYSDVVFRAKRVALLTCLIVVVDISRVPIPISQWSVRGFVLGICPGSYYFLFWGARLETLLRSQSGCGGPDFDGAVIGSTT